MVLMVILCGYHTLKAQVSITNTSTITIDFESTLSAVNNDEYDGTGVETTPASGHLGP